MKPSHIVILVVAFAAIALEVNAFTCNPMSLLYRSHDGECNNILFPQWGRAGGFYRNGPEGRERYIEAEIPRLVPNPTYADAHLLPDDGPRGNARNISNHVSNRAEPEVDPVNHSMFSIQYGQFVCHDIDANRMVLPDTNDQHDPAQFPLVTYIKEFDGEVMCDTTTPNRCQPENSTLASFARASGGSRDSNGLFRTGNQASAYFDLDHVYGRTAAANTALRTGSGGKLKMKASQTLVLNGVPSVWTNLLPDYTQTLQPVNPNFLAGTIPFEYVFSAGDDRVNENIALTFFHTLWAREHNTVCDELIESNFLWKLAPSVFDEIIYQKARAITIAKHQHIIYEQYIPSTFGSPVADLVGEYTTYNPLLESNTLLSFASGAFRYAHFSFVNYQSIDQCGRAISFGFPSANPDAEIIFGGMTAPQPAFLQPLGVLGAVGGFENLARGLTNKRAAPANGRADFFIRNVDIPTGVVDLISLDIMRARYNQLPNYQKIRVAYHGADFLTNRIYGLPGCPANLENNSGATDPLACFTYITGDEAEAQILAGSYKKINLIDPLIGLGYEKHVPGSTVGRTAGNILATQFKRTRDSDRFFYRNNLGQFSVTERATILNTTIGEILRRNLADGFQIPDNVFVVPDNFRQDLIDSC